MSHSCLNLENLVLWTLSNNVFLYWKYQLYSSLDWLVCTKLSILVCKMPLGPDLVIFSIVDLISKVYLGWKLKMTSYFASWLYFRFLWKYYIYFNQPNPCFKSHVNKYGIFPWNYNNFSYKEFGQKFGHRLNFSLDFWWYFRTGVSK